MCTAREQLTNVCVRGQTRSDIHRRSEHVAASFHDWPVVHSDPHTRELRFLLDRAQEGEPHLERVVRVGRDDHHRVADGLHDPRIGPEHGWR